MTGLDTFSGSARAADATEFWVATTLALLAALAMLYGAFVYLKRKRVIEDLPTALIRSAPQGYVELSGHAAFMDGDEIFAALSMRPSVWYRYKVEKRERGSSGREARWVTIEQGTSDDLFYLVDATGRCAVDPDGATVTPTHRNVWYGTSRIPGRYHDSDGIWWARALASVGGRPFRYTERRIEPGDAIYALGNFITHGGGATRFDKDGAIGDLLREWKRDQAFMLKHFDANQDGEIDMDEWEQARAAAAQAVEKNNSGGGPPPVDVLGRTRDRRQPFVIHAGTEEQIITRCQRYATGLLLVSVPLLVFALWAFAVRLVG